MVKVSDKNGESDCTMVRTAHITHMKISDKNELQIVYTETLKQVLNSELSDVAKRREAPASRRAGAMSDNSLFKIRNF